MTSIALFVVLSVAFLFVLSLMFMANITARHRRVVCPETGIEVDVNCDPGQAAGAVLVGKHLRVTGCERWPEKANCDRACERCIYG